MFISRWRKTIIPCLLALCLLAGCDGPVQCLPKDLDAPPPSAVAPPAPTALKRVVIYYDVSTSLAGFLPADLAKSGPGYHYPLAVKYVGNQYPAQGAHKFYREFGSFIRPFGPEGDDAAPAQGADVNAKVIALATNTKAYVDDNTDLHGSSRVELALREAAKADADTLSIVFSDLFFCRDDGIKGMMDQSLTALGDALDKGRAVALVGISSRFRGRIYDLPLVRPSVVYQHKEGRLPFYILAIGQREHVLHFLADIQKNLLPAMDENPPPSACGQPAEAPPAKGKPAKEQPAAEAPPASPVKPYRLMFFCASTGGHVLTFDDFANKPKAMTVNGFGKSGALAALSVAPSQQQRIWRSGDSLELVWPATTAADDLSPRPSGLALQESWWLHDAKSKADDCVDRWRPLMPGAAKPLAWTKTRDDDGWHLTLADAPGRANSETFKEHVALLALTVRPDGLAWPGEGWVSQWDHEIIRNGRDIGAMDFVGTPGLSQLCNFLKDKCQILARRLVLARINLCLRQK